MASLDAEPLNESAARRTENSVLEELSAGDFIAKDILYDLEFSKQVQRLVMVDFPRALPTQTLTWSQIELIIYCLNLFIANR